MPAILLLLATGATLSSKAGPVTVGQLLHNLSAVAGEDLSAEGEIGRMLVVTSFEGVTVASFKKALALVVDAEWTGSVLARPPEVSRQYTDHIAEAVERNREDLRQFVRFARGELRAEQMPAKFVATIERMAKQAPLLASEIEDWTDQAGDGFEAGSARWVMDGNTIRYLAAYDALLGAFVVTDMLTRKSQDARQTFGIGEPALQIDLTKIGWQRTGEWKSLNTFLIEQGNRRADGVNGADIMAKLVDLNAIAVYQPTARLNSLAGYTAYQVSDGWVMLRPKTFDRPGMHLIDDLSTPDDRMTDPIATIDALVKAWTDRPFRYQDFVVIKPTPNRLTVPHMYMRFSSLWKALSSEEKRQALRRRLAYAYLNSQAQKAWLGTVPDTVFWQHHYYGDDEPLNLTAEEVYGCTVRVRDDVNVQYATETGIGSGMWTTWRGLQNPYLFDQSVEALFYLYDHHSVRFTVALPSGETFTDESEIQWYLGSVTYGELKLHDPTEHPRVAIENRLKEQGTVYPRLR